MYDRGEGKDIKHQIQEREDYTSRGGKTGSLLNRKRATKEEGKGGGEKEKLSEVEK